MDFGDEPDGPVLAHEVRYPGERLACFGMFISPTNVCAGCVRQHAFSVVTAGSGVTECSGQWQAAAGSRGHARVALVLPPHLRMLAFRLPCFNRRRQQLGHLDCADGPGL